VANKMMDIRISLEPKRKEFYPNRQEHSHF
jgi:hypothetical protein